MTKEELKQHCEKQVEECEKWAKYKGIEPSCKVYEEHKLILELIKALEREEYYKDLNQSYERTIAKLTEEIEEKQPSDDCVSRADVIKALSKHWLSGSCARRIIDEQIDKVKALPPVTPKFSTSDDCVSRADLLTQINELWETIETKTDFVNIVKASPLVTSTHGTCKDCENFCCPNGIMPTCKKCFRRVTGDFYCADFEKAR